MPDGLKVKMIKGPAEVIVKGACHVLARDVSGQTVKVRAGKTLPFEPSNRWCRLHARLGYGARLWSADPNEAGTLMWLNLAKRISDLASRKKTTVMLVGDTDTGKSTLAIYLANMAIRRGLVPSIIDGDIGQGDLAPPTAIGSAFVSKQVVDLRDVNNSLFEFVGSISPVGFEELIVKKLRSMLNRTSPLADISIVNTDGYVRYGGIEYKSMIAQELQPDAIISLGKNILSNRWRKVQQQQLPCQILRARSSSQAYKSRLERLNHRLDQFLRYIGDENRIANLSQIKFDYMNMLFSSSDLRQPPIKQLEPENMVGMFVGLGSNNTVLGFGIIININPDNGIIHIKTNINSFDNIYLSNIRLSGNRILEARLT